MSARPATGCTRLAPANPSAIATIADAPQDRRAPSGRCRVHGCAPSCATVCFHRLLIAPRPAPLSTGGGRLVPDDDGLAGTAPAPSSRPRPPRLMQLEQRVPACHAHPPVWSEHTMPTRVVDRLAHAAAPGAERMRGAADRLGAQRRDVAGARRAANAHGPAPPAAACSRPRRRGRRPAARSCARTRRSARPDASAASDSSGRGIARRAPRRRARPSAPPAA